MDRRVGNYVIRDKTMPTGSEATYNVFLPHARNEKNHWFGKRPQQSWTCRTAKDWRSSRIKLYTRHYRPLRMVYYNPWPARAAQSSLHLPGFGHEFIYADTDTEAATCVPFGKTRKWQPSRSPILGRFYSIGAELLQSLTSGPYFPSHKTLVTPNLVRTFLSSNTTFLT